MSPKSFKTVDPLVRSKETSPAIGYKIIPQSQLPPPKFFSIHTNLSPVFTQYPVELGGGQSKALCLYSRVSTALGRPPEDETQKSQGQPAREGICSGQLCKALSRASAIPAASASDARAATLRRKDEFTSILQNQGEAGNS